MERHPGAGAETMTAEKMSKDRRYIVYGLFAVFLLALGAAIYMQSGETTQNSPARQGRRGGGLTGPVPVLVSEAKRADVPVYLDGVGTVQALKTVTVLPQVDGKLIKVAFKEGQDVPQGFVLAEIDPATYQAAYDQAVAKKAQDEAQLANAKIDLERYTRLAQTNAVTAQQRDTQKALVDQLTAQVKQDQAAIDSAAATLGYTKIVAPIAGRTGLRLVDEGNIVHASATTGIVVLTQLKPISVVFTLPQQVLNRVNAAFAKGALTVETLAADNVTVTDHGTLRVIDNLVDQTTGTVKLKAELPNPDLQLWPGQFVNVRLLIDTLKDAIVVPTAAVQRGPQGTFVYAASDNKVAVKNVTVTQQDDTQAVIASGIDAGEQIVTSGFVQLTDGAAITISTTSGAPQDNTNAGEKKRGEGKRKRSEKQ
jgi:multidrug efflux system membrane fusion protein